MLFCFGVHAVFGGVFFRSKDSHVVFCHNEQRSFEAFVCLGSTGNRTDGSSEVRVIQSFCFLFLLLLFLRLRSSPATCQHVFDRHLQHVDNMSSIVISNMLPGSTIFTTTASNNTAVPTTTATTASAAGPSEVKNVDSNNCSQQQLPTMRASKVNSNINNTDTHCLSR